MPMERPQPSGKGLLGCQKLQVSVEVQLAILKRLFECVDELAAKEFAQHFLGQGVVVAGTNPTGVIGREAAGRHHTMNMRMSGDGPWCHFRNAIDHEGWVGTGLVCAAQL
jgi:hypothetical protein